MSDDVVYPWAEVLVNGRSVGVHPVTISAAVADDLPGRLNFGSGITQRTGVIRWDRVMGKNGLMLSPYRRVTDTGFVLPSPMDRIVVRMGVQETDPRTSGLQNHQTVFTGKVDYSTVAHDGYPVTHIVDNIDRLNHVVRFPAFRHHLPPKPDGQGRYRHIGFTPDSILTFLASSCGYHVTPPPTGAVYLSAPLQGTMHPTPNRGWGELAMAERERGDKHNLPTFEGTPNGLGVTQGTADWDITNSALPARLVISVFVGAAHQSKTYIYVRLANGTALRMVIHPDRAISVALGDTAYPTGITATGEYISMAMTPDGVVRAKAGDRETAIKIPAWETARVAGISLDAPAKSHLAGLNIYGTAANDTNHPTATFTPSAYIKVGYPYPLHLARSIRDEKAIDVIKEICAATCCICYLDGEGKLIIEYGRSAYGRPTAGTLTVKKAVKSYQVKDDSQLAARNVVVKYQTGEGNFTNRAGGSYVDLWEAPSKSLEAGVDEIFFLGPGEDEEWLEVDETFTYANNDDAARADFAAKNGSFSGVTVTGGTASNKSEWWGGGIARLERIVPWRYKLTLNPHNASTTKVPETNTVPKHMWGTGMPKVRGGAYLTFTDAEPFVVAGGSSTAADLTHDAGKWMTDTRAQDIAEFAAKYSQKPLPVLENLACFFDPTIQLGRRYTIDLTETLGMRVLCFVLGVDHDPANDTTALTVRVLEDLSPWVWDSLPENYRTFDAVTGDFTNFDALKVGK